MKKKTYQIIIIICTALTISFHFIPNFQFNWDVIAFPYQLIANVLRELSLQNSFGNILSWMIYIFISIIPIFYLLYRFIYHHFKIEDVSLIFISIGLFSGIYYLINPHLIQTNLLFDEIMQINQIIIGNMINGLILGYILFRLFRCILYVNRVKIQKYCSYIFTIIGILCVINSMGIQVSHFVSKLNDLIRNNTMFDKSKLLTSELVLVVEYVAKVIPQILIIWILSNGIDLFGKLTVNRYSKESLKSIKYLSKSCKISIIVSILSITLFNFIQLLLYPTLIYSNSIVDIPLLSICFMMLLLLFIEYLNENKQLKEDNDLFI